MLRSRGAVVARAHEQLLQSVSNGQKLTSSSSELDSSPQQASTVGESAPTSRGSVGGPCLPQSTASSERSAPVASSSGRVAWIAVPWPLPPFSGASALPQHSAAATPGLPRHQAPLPAGCASCHRHLSSSPAASASASAATFFASTSATGAGSRSPSGRRKGSAEGSRSGSGAIAASTPPEPLPAAVDFKDLASALGRAAAGGSGGSGGSAAAAAADPDAFNFVQVGRPFRMRLPQPQQSPASSRGPHDQDHNQDQAAEGGGGSSPQERRRQRWQRREEVAALAPGLGSGASGDFAHAASTTSSSTGSSSSSTDEELDDAVADEASAEPGVLERIPMLHPMQRQQTPLHPRAAAELWRAAEALAGSGRMVRVAVGRQGLTRGVLAQAGELLEVHELVRLYLLPNCSLEVGFVGWVAEAALDCVVLRTKGRTVTLYRERGLPRPPASFKQSPEDEPLPAGLGSSSSSSSGSSSNRSGGNGGGISSTGVGRAATATAGVSRDERRLGRGPADGQRAGRGLDAVGAAVGGSAHSESDREVGNASGQGDDGAESGSRAAGGALHQGGRSPLATRFRRHWAQRRELGVRLRVAPPPRS